MYEVPSNPDAARVLITKAAVLEHVNPTIVPRTTAAAARRPSRSAPREEKSA
jgi:ATP-dependent Clp protease ATP-binding subunit ClpX